jgi:hypothetical protein
VRQRKTLAGWDDHSHSQTNPRNAFLNSKSFESFHPWRTFSLSATGRSTKAVVYPVRRRVPARVERMDKVMVRAWTLSCESARENWRVKALTASGVSLNLDETNFSTVGRGRGQHLACRTTPHNSSPGLAQGRTTGSLPLGRISRNGGEDLCSFCSRVALEGSVAERGEDGELRGREVLGRLEGHCRRGAG